MKTAALSTANSCSIPIAAWQESLSLLLHRMYQNHVTTGEQLRREDPVAIERLNTFSQSTIDIPSGFVHVARQSVDDALFENDVQVALRGGVAGIPRGQLVKLIIM